MSWLETTIDAVTELVTKGTTPTTYGMPFTDEGVNFVKAEALNGDCTLDRAGFTFISPETHEKLKRSQLLAGDVLMTIAGANVGKCGLVRETDLPANTNQAVALMRVNREVADPRFVYYHFKQPWMLGYCRSLGGQAAQPNVNLANLKRFTIRLPDLPTQQRIAGILSAYDDLIENNRRRIGLLEQAARLLYREWFVHLRFPGRETTKIVNGLPEGWSIQFLGQVADFHLGKMLDQNKNKGDSLPYLANVNVRWGDFELTELREMRFEERELERFGLRNGDIVMCEGGEPGRCAIWREQLPRMMFQKALHRIRPLNGMNSEYLYRALSYQAKRGNLSGLFTGSTIKHLPKEKLALVTVMMPPPEILVEFERMVMPMSNQAAELSKQNAKLASARDLLLPRLMDGRIPV